MLQRTPARDGWLVVVFGFELKANPSGTQAHVVKVVPCEATTAVHF